VAEIFPPRRDEPLFDQRGVATLRFAEYLENMASAVSATSIEIESSTPVSPEVGVLNGSLKALKDRVDDFEASNDSDILNSKITAISAKVTRLIEDLIEAVNNLNTAESDNKALVAQQATIAELQLLNARFEETFETDIEASDV